MAETSDATTFNERRIRVFVSSTFLDLHDEREALTKHVFPKIRALCEARSVDFTGVDLRAGIPLEKIEEGLLRTCLAEVDKCRPFFIGVLADRFGSVPDDTGTTVRAFKWIADYPEDSLTALEIRHGFLNDPSASHAFFYFRESSSLTSTGSDSRLDSLKEEIRTATPYSLKAFRDPSELGEHVLTDLTAFVNRLFPADRIDTRRIELQAHETFRRRRTTVCVGGKEHADEMDRLLATGASRIVVTGDDGSGKSTVLGAWVERHEDGDGEPLVLSHFVGASEYSADPNAMMRRIMTELMFRCDVNDSIPEHPAALDLLRWLNKAALDGRITLVIDGIDKLDIGETRSALYWLPGGLSDDVRIIVSCSKGAVLDTLLQSGWNRFQVTPLSGSRIPQICSWFLERHGRELSRAAIDRIAATEACANPRFLVTLLEEIRLYGELGGLDEMINSYLESTDLVELFDRVLARYERDFDSLRPYFVEHTLSFLHTSRHGLQESELLDFLGYEDKRFPRAHWSTLFLNADHALTYRSGKIALGSSGLREAVRRRYLPNTEKVREVRHNLIHCLLYRGSTSAKVRELAWQLSEHGDLSNLATLLSNVKTFFELVWKREKWEVMRYWQRLENEGGIRADLVYADAIAAPQEVESPQAVWYLAILLAGLGYTEPSITLWQWLIQHYREENDEPNLAAALGHLGGLLRRSGRLQEALEAYEAEEAIARRLGLHRQVIFSLGNQAIVFRDLENLPRTLDAYERQKELIDSIMDSQLLVYYYNGIGDIQQKAGELGKALFSYQECARLANEIGDLASYQAAIGNAATAYKDLGRMDDALRSLDRQETICRDINYREGLVGALDNRGVVLHVLGRNDEALDQHRLAEMIAREIGFHYGMTQAMGHIAGLLQVLKREEEALEYMDRLAELWRRDETLHKLQEVLSVAASIRFNRAKSLADDAHYVESVQEFERCVAAARESGQFQLAEWAEQYVLWSLRQYVQGLLDQKDHDNALTVLERMERILMNRPQDSVELANIRETMFLTHNVIAADEEKVGRLDAASEAVDSMAAIAEAMDDDIRRRQALDCRLSVLRSKGDHANDNDKWEDAVQWYERARTIALQLEKDDVAELCGTNQIAVLYNEERRRFIAKRFADVLEITEKRIKIAKAVGNLDMEIDGWSTRAYVLGQELGETEAALNAARAGLEKCDPRKHGEQIARFEELIRQLEEGP